VKIGDDYGDKKNKATDDGGLDELKKSFHRFYSSFIIGVHHFYLP
jgi:hypothetical protein